MIDGKEGASGSSWKGPLLLPVRDDSMEQVTWEQCVLKDDKNLPDSGDSGRGRHSEKNSLDKAVEA